MQSDDLNEIERAGRRCAVCRSSRGWRRFEVVRSAEGAPAVLCGSCRARFANDPLVVPSPAARLEVAEAAAEQSAPPESDARDASTEPGPDRLRAALAEMPGTFSTAVVARAAGLSNEKALSRLQDLERRGEIRRIGNRWSTEPPSSAVAEAMDRLQARTSNLRIVRERVRVS